MASRAHSRINYLGAIIWKYTIKYSIQHYVLVFSAWLVNSPSFFQFLQNFEAFWNLPLSLLWHILEDALHGKHHGVFLDITIFNKWNLSIEVLNQSINLIHAVVQNWPGWASFTLRQNWFRSFFLPCRMHNHVWLSETFLDSDILLHSMDVLKNLEIWIGPWNAKNRCFLLHKRNLNSENCTSLGMQLEQ